MNSRKRVRRENPGRCGPRLGEAAGPEGRASTMPVDRMVRALLDRKSDPRLRRDLAGRIGAMAEKDPLDPALIQQIEGIAEAAAAEDREVRERCLRALSSMEAVSVPSLVGMMRSGGERAIIGVEALNYLLGSSRTEDALKIIIRDVLARRERGESN